MNAEIDISQVTLQTDRLMLRSWKESDLEDFYEYAKVDGVGQMAGWLPHKDREESAKILQLFISEKKTFAIEYDGKVIGSLGIELYDEKKFPEFQELAGRELGFVLSRDYWGRGIMPEAVQRVLRYLFDETGLDFLMCGHYTENRQSKRVQEKCGFRYYRLTETETSYGEKKECRVSVLYRAPGNAKNAGKDEKRL